MKKKQQGWRELLRVYWPASLLVMAAFVAAFQFIKPAPPDTIIIATGQAGGGYQTFASHYRDFLAREGIRLEIRQTAGSIENIALLQAGEVDVAFVQGGTAPVDGVAGLRSLGSLYFEPLWLFYREGASIDRLTDLRDMRVAVGADGSGTQSLVKRLLADNGLAQAVSQLPMGNSDAVNALESGEVDAAFFVTSATSKLIDRLVSTPGVRLASFQRADAYARRYRFLNSLVLPEGAVSLTDNIPAEDIRLLAPTANLVAGKSIHPALIDLLLQAAEDSHGQGGWFEAAGQFPAAEYLEFPLSKEAARFYKYGPPLLQRYMPFWAASLVDRLKIMLLPLFVLLIPLFKIMPPIYSWRMRSRIYRWYGELETVDIAFIKEGTARRDELLAELDRIENDVRNVQVPLSFAGQLYHLRQHVDLVRQKLLNA